MTVKEAAEALHRSERSVRRYLAQGDLQAEKVSHGDDGFRYAICAASVEELAEHLPADAGGAQGDGAGPAEEALQEVRRDLRELLSGQRALRPSDEELQARREREVRIEEALARNAETIRELAEDLGRLTAERDALAAEVEALREELAEARRSWLDRLRRR